MARLNRFIQALHERSAEALTLVGGEKITLSIGGQTVPLSKNPVSEVALVDLVAEITPPALVKGISGPDELSFSYAAPSGPVDVAVEPHPSGMRVSVSRQATDVDDPVTPTVTVQNGGNGSRGEHGRELDRLLTELKTTGGSDLHLRVGQPPLFRNDGRLVRLEEAPFDHDRIDGMLHAIMMEKDKVKHAETGDADFAYEIEGVARFRVNAARDRGGSMAVFRVIPTDIPGCDELGITKEVRNLCYLTKGLVLVTGPTGSGKSTTLAALVDLMNSERGDHILTIEDPIEFVHASKTCLVTHRQVGVHTKSFKSGLRAALREDPDILLIGEMRDLETAAIAIETAETGHLVFGTLHTTTAASTIDRIIDQFPGDRQAQIRVMLSESLQGVVAQTLCRKIGGGRVAAREILLTNPAVSNLIREGKTFQLPSIIQTNKKSGMTTLNDSLIELVDKKLVESKEAYMKSVDKVGMQSGLRQRGHDVAFLTA